MQAPIEFQQDQDLSTLSYSADYDQKYFFGNYGFYQILARIYTRLIRKNNGKITKKKQKQ